jgi:50S ribosomal protein L16 3-hydroxylase
MIICAMMARRTATMPAMDVEQALPLLGGLSPAQFMRRHWHRKPLLVRQAWPGVRPPVTRAQLFKLAGSDEVESRLVWREGARWRLRQGPLPKSALPPVAQTRWTLLVQGLDLHAAAAHDMLRAFRFVPDARLDDLMLSWASPGGGVGPHLDSYDVFLLQVQGRRRWRVGPSVGTQWVAGAPLKLLKNFKPEHDWVLDSGDMLYLPPGWGHDGVAVGGDCMTCSVGFRAPARHELSAELLQRLAEETLPRDKRYGDPQQSATAAPAALPPQLLRFAQDAVRRRLADPGWLERALGEWLTEPKAQVNFPGPGRGRFGGGVRLTARSRMLHSGRWIFINGEALLASGADARWIQRLADQRQLLPAEVARLSVGARRQLDEWISFGWAEGFEPA